MTTIKVSFKNIINNNEGCLLGFWIVDNNEGYHPGFFGCTVRGGS